MSLYPEQKQVIDKIYGLLRNRETAQSGAVEVQMQLMIQWMLVANALEVIAETTREINKKIAPQIISSKDFMGDF